MSEGAVAATTAGKVCVKCGVDVAGRPRQKDEAGNYYCAACAGMALESADTSSSANRTTAAQHGHGASPSFGLSSRITCPHCWHVFPRQDVLWISAHQDLKGDAVLGSTEKARRFLPTRFTIDGQALDARNVPCQQLACPRCHLGVPRAAIETQPLFISIIGGPKTGKSYLLSAMTWQSRNQLPSQFAVVFNDADAEANVHLNEYEATLFLAQDPDKLVALAKTDESGDLYDQANINGHAVSLPRPFLFNVRPAPHHPHAKQVEQLGRVLCLYDNAGESFQPGKDTATSPVTQHLAKAKVLMFLFDPTQDPRFREKCRHFNHDPQLTAGRVVQRQETLLSEAAARVRRYANLPTGRRHDRPLLVIVPKSDIWGSLIDEDLVSEPILPGAVGGLLAAVDVRRIERVSRKLRALLLKETPELVAAAEDFCQPVVYIPVSALGTSPEETPLPGGGTGLFIRPGKITPHWTAVPLLYLFAKWTTGLIASNVAVGGASSGRNDAAQKN